MIYMQLFSVEHQFEIIVEDIRGLSVFGNTVWGETDCFVQYHFPFQRLPQLMQVAGQGKLFYQTNPLIFFTYQYINYGGKVPHNKEDCK